MKRRGFLGALLGLLAVPAAAAAAAPAVRIGVDMAKPGSDATGVLLRGELGRWDGVRIIREDKDFYYGLQWDAEDLAELQALGRQPLVINVVRPLVDREIALGRYPWASS